MVLLDPPAASTSSAAPASQWIKVMYTILIYLDTAILIDVPGESQKTNQDD